MDPDYECIGSRSIRYREGSLLAYEERSVHNIDNTYNVHNIGQFILVLQ